MGYTGNRGDYGSSEYGDYGNRDSLDNRYQKQTKEQAELSESAVERAANNAQSRMKDTGRFVNNLSQSGAKSSLQDKITMAREESSLSREREADKAGYTASESAKNRESDTFNKNAANASNNASVFDSNASQKTIAIADNRTKEAGQQSAVEQAKIAAQAQVSAAILGNRGNYGGYW